MARAAKGYRQTFKLIGGPWDGQKVQLYSAGTLEFSVKSFDPRPGRYVPLGNNYNLIWEFTNE